LGNVSTVCSNAGQVRVDLVEKYDKMACAFHTKFGVKFPLGQGYRPLSQQAQIYNDPKKVNSAGKRLGAYPGTSNHGFATAIDWNTTDSKGVTGYESEYYKWMAQNAPAYGFSNPAWAKKGGSKEEPWHWEAK